MIYLIEDRRPRMEQYMDGYNPPASEVTIISDIQFGNSPEEIANTLVTRLPGPRAVLCHRGHVALRKNTGIANGIKKYYEAKGVSFVYFSGSISDANYARLRNSFFANINSRIFYANLQAFIEGTQDVRILCFGKQYLLNEFLMFTNLISSHLHQLANSDSLDRNVQEYILELVKDYKSQASDQLADIYSEIEQLFQRNDLSTGLVRDQLKRYILKVNYLSK